VNGVILSGVSAVAMVAGAGATLAASRIAVTGTVPAADGNYGRALIAQEQAQVTVSHAVIADHADSSVTAVGEGTHLELRDVVVRDTRGAPAGNVGRGLGVDLGADVLLERVEIARANDMGIGVFRGTVTADYLVVRDTVGFEIATEITGPAVAVGNRARFDATRSVFHGNNTYTIWVDGGGEVTLEDAVVRDTLAYADGYYGYGIMVLEAGSFSATRIVLERNRTSALRAYGETAEAVLTDATIRDSLPADADGTYGRGVEVLEGALVTLRRARLERNRADGVFVVNGTVELEDVVVRDTMSQDRENDGRGVSCGTGCVATGRRVFLDANGAAGWFAGGESSTITDFVVRGTQGRALGNTVSGAGLDVRDGTTASASRVIALENHMLGVTASGAGTSLTLEDAVVRDTRLRDGQYGFGLVGFTGASLALSRVEVADNTAGLWVKGPDTTLSVTDAWFHDMRSAPVTMRGGEGIVLIDGVVATLTRVAVERTMRAGLLVHGGSEAMLDRFRARDVMREACGDACGGGFGIGLLAQVGSTVRATGFELSGAPLCGVYLADGSSVDLIDGEIAGNDIGACVRVSDYDVARLTQRVRYRDNRVNVETVDFSVPEPEVSLDGL
jgi:hypothetical protein